MTAVAVLLILGAAVLLFVAAPLLRSDAADAERVASARSESVDLQSRQAMLVEALRDLDDDRATGKLDDADYAALKSQLSSDAVQVLRRIDAHDLERRQAPPPGPRALPADTDDRSA